jgi:eukaryotic-like serine/threonine-protein kinase
MSKKIIHFVRQRDYEFVEELGRGSCGETILLYDDIIRESFVCKKYAPLDDQDKKELFDNFVQEIKILHQINHKNIVRIFNYYIYRDSLTGYILMEFVKGFDVEDYLKEHPENINEIFWQTISGFTYLEGQNILHRDVRPPNLMVTEYGVVKIIDFGFGKQIYDSDDFDKSISLNWWCEPPPEFKESTYNFQTEVYFVGKLFEKIIKDNNIGYFKHNSTLNKMCKQSTDERTQSFFEIRSGVLNERFAEIEFDDDEKESYKNFSSSLYDVFSQLYTGAKFFDDASEVLSKLEELHRSVMLEDYLPSPVLVARCIVNGGFTYMRNSKFPVWVLKEFIELFRSCSNEKQNIILSNIHTKLDSLERKEETKYSDDIPF